MGASKQSKNKNKPNSIGRHHCCGLGSRIPLRGQMVILLVICAILFIVCAPGVIAYVRLYLTSSFEADIAYTNINRCMASMEKTLIHEENVLEAYAVWTVTADAVEVLAEGDVDTFEEFLVDDMFDYGHWSDWTCGNLLAFYSKHDENGLSRLLWSEYHKTDPDTLEMDIETKYPVPSVFNNSEFIKANVNGYSQQGFLAVEDCVLVFSCREILDTEEYVGHGFICRAVDVLTTLESISSGAGACISIYNMASDDIPAEYRSEFEKLKSGERTNDNKFSGEYSIIGVGEDDWNASKLPLRTCGPAEQSKANISKRTLSFLHMQNAHHLLLGNDENKNGLGLILDNARELEPIVAQNFNVTNITLSIFGLILFIAFGLIAECRVLRKLDLIAEAAYGALVEGEEEEYQDYYTGSKTAHPEKRRERGKNELITMATLAAQTVEKNGRELERKRDHLAFEKMQGSLVADQLRLLALYCDRRGDEALPFLKYRKKRSRAGKTEDSFFFTSASDFKPVDGITFDRVLNDPFALELFKNFSVKDPDTGTIRYPARKSILFLLSTYFYRSMADVSCTDARVECIKGIVEEFFGVQASLVSTKRMPTLEKNANDLGISDAARKTLLANASKCISSRRPSKSLFDESSSAVRDNLQNAVFPLFTKSPVYALVRLFFAQKKIIHEKVEQAEMVYKSERPFTRTEKDAEALERKKMLGELNNTTNGTHLSHRALEYFNGF